VGSELADLLILIRRLRCIGGEELQITEILDGMKRIKGMGGFGVEEFMKRENTNRSSSILLQDFSSFSQ